MTGQLHITDNLPQTGPQPAGARDLSPAANLRRLALLTKDWPGQPLDPQGTIRLLNPDAPGPPLFWYFNGQAEFPALAAAFASSRPLIGMRSLNQIIPSGPTRYFPDMELADHYAAHILRHFGPVRCIIGGNCQAASVAHGVAQHLLAAGANVERLVTLDAVTRRPYRGHMRLLFGANSAQHNPFLTQSEPPAAWHYLYGSHDWQILPAAHGQFFWPDNLGTLAHAIEAQAPSDSAPHRPATGPHWRCAIPGPHPAGGQLDLIAPARPSLVDGLMLMAHWRRPGVGSWVCDRDRYLSPIRLIQDQGLYAAQVQLPDQPGLWALQATPCARQTGPLTGHTPLLIEVI